jgi:hypothetical protein
MAEIPVFRIHTERMAKDKFATIATHLGLAGELTATDEALFIQDKGRALAYAMPGSRFAGLLFFTDQSQGMATQTERVPGSPDVEAWTNDFLKRFQLGPGPSGDDRIQVSFGARVLRTESVVQEGKEGNEVRRAAVKIDVVADLRVNDLHVTGPRAKLRLAFKNAKAPIWIHRALWEKLDVFETRPMLTEDEAYRRLSDRLVKRGESRRNWRMSSCRLAYFAGEFTAGPDLLLPYYFAEVEMRDPNDRDRTRQGPRQLIQLPACR